MPTLRLEEVLAEHTILPELAVHVDRLRAKGTSFDKLDANTATDLRAISEALKISLFDIIVPSEQLYRLKIIEYIGNRYSGNLKQQLEALQADLPESKKNLSCFIGSLCNSNFARKFSKGSRFKRNLQNTRY